MDYLKIYNKIINKALKEPRDKKTKYYERHHIIPKCMGGSDNIDNLVNLTAKEHFVCHHLLYRAYKNTEHKYSLGKAWHMICLISNGQSRIKINANHYTELKFINSEFAKHQFSGKKLSKSLLESRKVNNPNKRNIVIDGIFFNQLKDAANYYGVSVKFIRDSLEDPNKGERYIIDIEYRKLIKSKNISNGKKNNDTRSGKTFEEIFGQIEAQNIKNKISLSRKGYKHSDETRKKLSESRLGVEPWNKGIKLKDETRKKLSESRLGKSISKYDYKVIDPDGNIYIVEKIGLSKFWKNTFKRNKPGIFKGITKTENMYIKCESGKFKGFEVYVLPKHNTASIESIEEIEYNDDVYDIEVLDNHNYFANGHLVHNCNRLVLEGCFGPVYKVITTKQLMDNNSVVNLKIKAVILNYDEEIRKMMKKTSYQKELEFIVTNIKRNKFITNLTVSCKGNTLVLFQFVEKHGHVLYDMIKQKAGDRSVYYIHGGTDVSDRENVRSILEKETDSIIIASVGVFSTGINIPSIQNIIFASPSKSKIRNLQSIGRGLRNNKDKTHCKLFDIADNLSYKSHKNFTLQHAEIRYKLYMEEQFEMQLIEYNL